MQPPDAMPAFGLIDLSARAKLRFTGEDRVRFLNGQVSNNVRRAAADQSIYACVMTIKGKMCADAFIHAGADSLLVDAEGELRETLAARLERYIIADDVQMEDVSEELGLWHLLPLRQTAQAASGPALPDELKDLPPSVQAVHSQRFGATGWDLFFPVALAPELRSRLTTLAREIDPAELERRRIAAGTPRWGAELDENTMPAEADLEDRAVDYAKGCYIGQEVVSRVKSVGHVNRHLCGLRALDPAAPLVPGMRLYPADAPEPRGKEVGRITSVAPGADGQPTIALGYVRRGADAPGFRLEAILSPDPADPSSAPQTCQVEVCALPMNLP